MSNDPTADRPASNDPARPDPTSPGPSYSSGSSGSPTPPPYGSGPSASSPYGSDSPPPPSPYGGSTPQAPVGSYGSTPSYQPAYPAAGQGGYGMYGGGEHPQGTIVLILGILGIVVCGLCAPFAWVMGRKALREVDANPSAYTNRGQLQAGMICGIIGTVLWVLAIIFYVFIIVLAIGSASTTR